MLRTLNRLRTGQRPQKHAPAYRPRGAASPVKPWSALHWILAAGRSQLHVSEPVQAIWKEISVGAVLTGVVRLAAG